MADWKFYGRKDQLADLERMLGRKRWFFAKVSGRRRIGKTTLIQQAMQEIDNKQPVLYSQSRTPTSRSPLGLNDALETFQVPHRPVSSTPQFFSFRSCWRRWLKPVTSSSWMSSNTSTAKATRNLARTCRLGRSVAAKANQVRGGFIVLRSIHTKMMALLEDLPPPLYNRVTDTIDLTHLDIGSILSILRDHADPSSGTITVSLEPFEGFPSFTGTVLNRKFLPKP